MRLLRNCGRRRLPLEVDGVIVPSGRPAEALTDVAELAADIKAPLVVLCSGDSDPRQVAAVMGAARGASAKLPAGGLGHSPWWSLRTLDWGAGRPQTYVDRSLKRNIGLLVARMMGWRRVLFMDDDIRSLDPDAFLGASGHLGASGVRVAGWTARRFPDNSVMCHAFRAAGGRQDVFVGAGALLVDVTGWLPYFPSVYNEDWLFLYDFLRRGEAGHVRHITQLVFDPFAEPARAYREEFGDVLAEGLFALLHERRTVAVACFGHYWDDVVRERRAMLDHIDRELWRRRDGGHQETWDGHDIHHVMKSVIAARDALNGIQPYELAEFTSLWRHDLYRWNSHLPRLPRFSRVVDALDFLGVTEVHRAGG